MARKTQTVSEFGSQLDTVADGVFAIVCLIRLLPVLEVPAWVWVWTAVIALIKAVNLLSGFVCRKKFVAEHTLMNKISPAVTACVKEDTRNPKRRQRDIRKQLQHTGIGTKSQQALKLQQEQSKQERKAQRRERKQADAQRLFALKQQKKRDKHRGH